MGAMDDQPAGLWIGAVVIVTWARRVGTRVVVTIVAKTVGAKFNYQGWLLYVSAL